jgi:hypothetical protein
VYRFRYCQGPTGRHRQTAVSPTLSFVFAKALLELVLNSLWYQRQLDRLSRGLQADPKLSILWTLSVTFSIPIYGIERPFGIEEYRMENRWISQKKAD